MLDREFFFAILIEALFPDRQTGMPCNISEKNRTGPKKLGEADWEEIVRELNQQTVLGVASIVLKKKETEGIPVKLQDYVTMKRRKIVMRYTQMAVVQREICQKLEGIGISVAVMKGMAAACYYPNPMLRMMGDIDLIVKPDEYEDALCVLRESGFVIDSKANEYHIAVKRNDITIELHKSPASTHKDAHGDFIRDFILSGLDAVEIGTAEMERFPILPWKQNGMELIWHIRQHLYNGLGLRQIIDWMMFVDHCLDNQKYIEFEPALEKSGLKNLAITTTKMCQKYLGLRREGISWCIEADEQLCDDLMDYILEQGNFGIKKPDDKTAKIMSGYPNLGILLKELQRRGIEKWPAAEKRSFLKPFAWSYAIKEYIVTSKKKDPDLLSIIRNYKTARRRKKMFSKLYTLENRGDK